MASFSQYTTWILTRLGDTQTDCWCWQSSTVLASSCLSSRLNIFFNTWSFAQIICHRQLKPPETHVHLESAALFESDLNALLLDLNQHVIPACLLYTRRTHTLQASASEGESGRSRFDALWLRAALVKCGLWLWTNLVDELPPLTRVGPELRSWVALTAACCC